jgi:hypothetical protein
MALLEDCRNLGHDINHQKRHDRGTDAEHDDRIGQRAAHSCDEFRLFFAVLGEPVEHDLQRTRSLTRAHHAHIEIGEGVLMGCQSVGQRRTLADAFTHLGKNFFDDRARRLLGQRSQGVNQLHACTQEGRKLPAYQRDFNRRQTAIEGRYQIAQSVCPRASLFGELGRENSHPAQLAARTARAVGVNHPGDRTPLWRQAAISENRHRKSNRPEVAD